MIRPLYDNVVLEMEEESDIIDCGQGIRTKKASGQKIQDTGIVAACGIGRVSVTGNIVPLIVKKGDKVIFNKYAGTEITSEGKLFLVMKESDILAIL